MPKAMPASLRQKMAQASTGAKPSLLPPGVGGKPLEIEEKAKKTEEEAPEINELIAAGPERNTIRKLVRQFLDANERKKAAEKEADALGILIKPYLDSYGITAMKCDGAGVSYFPLSRKSISANLLLAAGIPQETINECTTVSSSKSLVIRPPKP